MIQKLEIGDLFCYDSTTKLYQDIGLSSIYLIGVCLKTNEEKIYFHKLYLKYGQHRSFLNSNANDWLQYYGYETCFTKL